MRYSVNTLCMFPGVPFAEALDLTRAKGYDTVEVWTIDREEVAERARLLANANMRLSAFCPAYFVLNDIACHDQYEACLRDALEDAATLCCPALITQVGNDTGAPRAVQHAAIVQGLKRMAPLLKAAGVTLLVEPLNDVKDHVGYYLTDSQEGFDIVREVGSPFVRLLYDVYHMVHMGEDVLAVIRDNIGLIGHFHIAGHPNRDEKLFEGFDHTQTLALIRSTGAQAPMGLELWPTSRAGADALLQALQTNIIG